MRSRVWILCIFAIVLAVSGGIPPVRAELPLPGRFGPALQRLVGQLQAEERLAVIIHLNPLANPVPLPDRSSPPGGRRYHPDGGTGSAGQTGRQQAVIEILQSRAAAAQRPLLKELQAAQARGEAGRVVSLWINNSILVEAGPGLLAALAQRPEVAQIVPDFDPANPIVPVGGRVGLEQALAVSAGPPEPNLTVIGATDLWALGNTGQGITVAVLDTGVDAAHPDLAGRYRGGTNSWFDPYGQHATPYDYLGHGTWAAGVIVGDGTGNGTTSRSTGVAPGAQWIAAKIFPTPPKLQSNAAVHLAFQWVLDPDGNPATPDAPQVVNNSWDFSTPGCNLEFQADLLALRAAGILPVFAAGNYGPGANTSSSPANNLGAFSVGAVDNSGLIVGISSRGVNACDPTRIFPSVVAPGFNIVTTDLLSRYAAETGTSLAAPHASGGLALLLAAYPHLSPDLQEQLLIRGAVDLGAVGPDPDYGNGLLNLPAALAVLQRYYVPYVSLPVYRLYIPLVQN